MRITREPRLPFFPFRFFPAPLSLDEPCHSHSTSIALVLLSLFLLIPATATGQLSEQNEQDLETAFRAGQAALRHGDFNRATEEFQKALAIDPGLVEAQVNLGLAYQSLFDYDAAALSLAHALRERPNLAGVNVIVGMDYLKLGSPEKAAPYLKHGLELDPSSPDAHEAMALYSLTQDNFQGAMEQYRKIAELDPDKAEALFKIGHQYLDMAARLAYRGARLYPESPWGHRFLGDMLLARSRWDDAAQEYKKALAIDPQQPGLHALLGETNLHTGHLAEAEAEFRNELDLDPRYEPAMLGLANIQLAKGDASAALASVTAVWQNSPEYLKAQPDFPYIELTEENARACISSLAGSNPADSSAAQPAPPAKHYLLAAIYSAVNENARSARESRAFQDVLSKRQPASQLASQAHADFCKLHLYSRCIASLQQAKPLTASAYLVLGRTYFTLQQYENAADALSRVHGDKDTNAEASYWLEQTYQALGALAYSQLEESFPRSWRTHQLRAEDFALRGDPDNAIKEYEAALQLRPNEAELHEAFGEFYIDNHSDDDALTELQKAESFDPSRVKTLYLLGRIYVLDNESDKAVPVLKRALQLQPNLNEASGLLGTAYIRMGKFADAIPSLQKAAPLDHLGNIHYQLYQAYRKLGQADLAQKALARSQEIRSSSLEHDQALIMGARQVEADTQ